MVGNIEINYSIVIILGFYSQVHILSFHYVLSTVICILHFGYHFYFWFNLTRGGLYLFYKQIYLSFSNGMS